MEVPGHYNSSSDVALNGNSGGVTARTSVGATSHVRNDPSPAGQITQTLAEPGRQEDVVVRPEPAHKSVGVAYVLCILLGLFGAHHFYLRRKAFGLFYVFTLGMLGCGWIVDLFRIPQLVRNANKKIDHPHEFEPQTISDAYILWFPLGFLGFHQYYLRGAGWGVTYTFTFGVFGIGWIADAFRIPSLVRESNSRREEERAGRTPTRVIRLDDAYILGLSPAGIFGAHHFYMGNKILGGCYAGTFGLVLQGWVVDWVRMYWLVDRANHPDRHPLGKRHKYLDDAYVLGANVPFGLFGLHHYYLERPAWFRLYMVTHGLFGIGWLVDLLRMPCLVSETNKRLEAEQRIITAAVRRLGSQLLQLSVQNFNNGQLSIFNGTGTLTPQSSNMILPPPYSAAANGNDTAMCTDQPPPPYSSVETTRQ